MRPRKVRGCRNTSSADPAQTVTRTPSSCGLRQGAGAQTLAGDSGASFCSGSYLRSRRRILWIRRHRAPALLAPANSDPPRAACAPGGRRSVSKADSRRSPRKAEAREASNNAPSPTTTETSRHLLKAAFTLARPHRQPSIFPYERRMPIRIGDPCNHPPRQTPYHAKSQDMGGYPPHIRPNSWICGR
jgi:hypothetical protein